MSHVSPFTPTLSKPCMETLDHFPQAAPKLFPQAFTAPQVSAANRELPEQTELHQSVHCASCQSESRTPGPLSSLGRAEVAFVRTSVNNTAALGICMLWFQGFLGAPGIGYPRNFHTLCRMALVQSLHILPHPLTLLTTPST